jgi:two-component system CheB/CheR fusion protein
LTLECATVFPRRIVDRFEGRLSALARAHDLLVKSEWRGIEFGELVSDQLARYTSEQPERLRIDGVPIVLPADLATPFGLVLHELATNAVKHGSLSRNGGSANLGWMLRDGQSPPVLTMVWREAGGLPVVAPTPKAWEVF